MFKNFFPHVRRTRTLPPCPLKFFAVFAAVGFEILLFGKGLVKGGGSVPLICAGASVAFVLSLIFDGASSAVAGIYLTGGASLAVFAVASVLSLIA